MFTDQLSITVDPDHLVIGQRATAKFTATANGKKRKKKRFKYRWKKYGGTNFPDKVSGVNGAVLTIPNVLESDEGQYYCIVTNEWDRRRESNNVTLAIYGI